ncbi:CGI-121-domain-containing protein [Acephala macrosclerotiorum]|nr:CGI-121-domain-containing protein [Acephala macrosclerotiorum]
MALLQTVQLEHLPPSHSIHIALYRNIQNAAFLQQQLLDGNTDFEYALIDASVIVSKIHALAAVYRAVNDLLSNRLRSRNVHSEIVFSLSPNNNIAESFRRFGIQPTTTSLLLIKISTPESQITAEQLSARLATQVQVRAREVDERREMEVLILGAMALRGATN